MGAIQQIFPLGGAAAGVLPNVTSLFGGYSVLKLVTTATNCLRVRRSSDNAEQDIGFVGAYIDSASMLSFVGANNGFVKTWYDQSGNGNDITQATTTKQPQIVYSGTYYGWAFFDGVDDLLTSSASTATPTGITVYVAGRERKPPQDAAALGTSHPWYYINNAKLAFTCSEYSNAVGGSTNDAISPGATGNAAGINYFNSAFSNNSVATAVHNLAAVTVATQTLLYVDGVAQASVTTGGSTMAGNFAAATISLAGDGSHSAGLAAQTFLWYETVHSSGTIDTIRALIPAYNGTPTVTNNLDSYLTSCTGIYALVKQRSAYAGSCLRVRRSSDNTEQDIGFVSGVIDTASMLTFCGVGNGFVTKWYDQAASANDLVQATAGSQPQIVSSGSYLGYVKFDGTDDILTQTSNSGTPAAFTAYVKTYLRGKATTYDLCNHGNTSSPDCTMTWQTGAPGIVNATITAGGNSVSNYNTQYSGQVVGCNFVRGAASFALSCQTYNGGALMTADSRNDSGSIPTGTFTAGKWNLGARVGGGTASPSNYYAAAFYEANHAAATADAVSGILG